MINYLPPDRIELHTAVGALILHDHADDISRKKITREEVVNIAYAYLLRNRLSVGNKGELSQFQAYISSADYEFSTSHKPEFDAALARCAEIAELMQNALRRLRDALCRGQVIARAYDGADAVLTPAYWRSLFADIAIATGIAELPLNGQSHYSRFVFDRHTVEKWIDEVDKGDLKEGNHKKQNRSANTTTQSMQSMPSALPLDLEPFWDVDQALIWIATRDLGAVKAGSTREHSPDTFLLICDSRNLLLPKDSSSKQLLNALSGGLLEVRAFGKNVPAAAFDHAHVSFQGEPDYRAILHGICLESEDRQKAHFDLTAFRISARDIMRIWPAISSQPVNEIKAPLGQLSQPAPSASLAERKQKEKQFKAEFRKKIVRWQSKEAIESLRPTVKQADELGYRYGLSRDTARSLLKEVQAEFPQYDWAKPGRKSSLKSALQA
ncbi:hypothetical protein SAMN06297251_11298 [Fulvimarina manganoxydans]|uniref:Uncharacterized protein n=1 Tax=Fulvimarina manganoxydans TaxID=937218 RepID=A0A1W2D458_9HYPH|nr:hypothetical protein [Fulvimarina manganoxydans]SMC92006.1 hypothetical protein SAMN06297251_11298 [Fulvimarina manganoxydans]